MVFKVNTVGSFVCFGLWFVYVWALKCHFVSLGVRLLEAMVEFGQVSQGWVLDGVISAVLTSPMPFSRFL